MGKCKSKSEANKRAATKINWILKRAWASLILFVPSRVYYLSLRLVHTGGDCVVGTRMEI